MGHDRSIPSAINAKKIAARYQSSLESQKRIQEERDNYRPFFESRHKLAMNGFLALAALALDFIINKEALLFLQYIFSVKVAIFALIFLVLDAFLAVQKSGVAARSAIEHEQLTSRFRPILWSVGLLKITLFLTFIFVAESGVYEHDLLFAVILIFFILLVYTTLDKAGDGLFYFFTTVKLALKEFWVGDPEQLKSKVVDSKNTLDALLARDKIEKIEVYREYNLLDTYTKLDLI